MRNFLQGRIDLVKAMRASSLPVAHQDLELILTAVLSACASYRWPGEGFDGRRFVQSLIEFGSPTLNLDHISTGALLEFGMIDESETAWSSFGERDRIFTGEEIDGSLDVMLKRHPKVTALKMKRASYAHLIYRWLRCGYAHNYWVAGNTTHVAASHRSAQISYIGRILPNGRMIRVASFHFEYLIEVVEEQVITLADKSLEKPKKWWLDQE